MRNPDLSVSLSLQGKFVKGRLEEPGVWFPGNMANLQRPFEPCVLTGPVAGVTVPQNRGLLVPGDVSNILRS